MFSPFSLFAESLSERRSGGIDVSSSWRHVGVSAGLYASVMEPLTDLGAAVLNAAPRIHKIRGARERCPPWRASPAAGRAALVRRAVAGYAGPDGLARKSFINRNSAGERRLVLNRAGRSKAECSVNAASGLHADLHALPGDAQTGRGRERAEKAVDVQAADEDFPLIAGHLSDHRRVVFPVDRGNPGADRCISH